MSHEPEDSEIRGGEGIDPGEPIAVLVQFEHDCSGDLIVHIRRAIQRRTTAGQLASFAARIPLVVLKEFWQILNQQFGPIETPKDKSHGEEPY